MTLCSTIRALAPTSRRGVSLMETMVLLGMTSMVAALGLPRLNYIRFRVNSDARNVVMTLAYAQRIAVSLQHNVKVTLHASLRQVRTLEDKNNDGLYSADERIRVFQLSEGVVLSRNGAPDLPSPAATNEITEVTFWRDGSASTAGVVYLNTTLGISKGNNEDARGLDVVRATGRATWYTYTGGSWRRGI